MADTQTERPQSARPVDFDLPLVDVRRKRPPALAFLLRMETLRQALRVSSLLVLDFVGVFGAIYVALMVKAVLRYGDWAWTASFDETRNTIAFAYLVTVLLFARSGLYASRAERPGLSRIVSSLAQVTLVALIFALVNGEEYSSYYIFYGTLAFAIFFIGSAALAVRARHRRRAAARGLPPPGGARRLRQAHRGRRARAQGRGARAGRDGRLRVARPAAGQRAALAGPDRGHARGARRPPGAGGHHRRPGLPPGPRGRARRSVPPARGDGADRAVHDGDPGAPGGVRAGGDGAAVRAAAAGVRRLRLRGQADVRLRRLAGPADRALPLPAADRDRRRGVLAGPGPVSLDAARGSAESRSRA